MLAEKFAANDEVKVNEVVNDLIKEFRAFKKIQGVVINGLMINIDEIKAVEVVSSFQETLRFYDCKGDSIVGVWIKDIKTIYFCYIEEAE